MNRCSTCGQPSHTQYQIEQAVEVPPSRRPEWQRYAVAVLVLLGALAVIAQGGAL